MSEKAKMGWKSCLTVDIFWPTLLSLLSWSVSSNLYMERIYVIQPFENFTSTNSDKFVALCTVIKCVMLHIS